MADNSTQKSGDSHGEKVDFEIEECFSGFSGFVNFICVQKTKKRYQQIGCSYHWFVDSDSPEVNNIYLIHALDFYENLFTESNFLLKRFSVKAKNNEHFPVNQIIHNTDE